MAKRRPWVARRLQTVRFKGRPARGLLWKKAIYKEWFEYAKLATTLPKEFGDVKSFNFEDWWRHPDYGFELFCEPVEEPPFEEVTLSSYKERDSKVLISLNLEQPANKIIHNLRNYLKRIQPEPPEYKSRARFIPSAEPKRIMVEKLKRYRLAYLEQVKGLKRQQIAEKLIPKGLYGRTSTGEPRKYDSRRDEFNLRVVTRDISLAKKIIKNVEKGVFP
jgi:hypothetical protein